MKKKLRLTLLSLFLTGLIGYGQNIGGQFTVDDIRYKITATAPGKVEIVGYTGSATEVTIPLTVDHVPNTFTVTAIGGGESEYEQPFFQKGLTRVTIPNTVTSIGIGAFNKNKLTEVAIPNGVTSIGQWTFAQNKLTEVTIPGHVESIGYQAFYGNPNLSLVTVKRNDPPGLDEDAFQNPNRDQIDVVVPKGTRQRYLDNGWTGFRFITEVVGVRDTFSVDHITYKITSIDPDKKEVAVTGYNTSGGTVVDIPETVDNGPNTFKVTIIGHKAFQGKGLTSVTIPNTVTSIKEDAFYKNQLTSVVIPESVTSLGQRAFGSNKLTEVTIPNGVTRIEQWTFAQNVLKELTIPANVEYIGYQAFYGLENIPIVRCERNPPPEIHETAFDTPSGPHFRKMDLVVPFTAIKAYEDAGWKEYFGFVRISSGNFTVDGIKYGIISPSEVMVLDYTNYTGTAMEVTIPETVMDNSTNTTYTVTVIGDYAFEKNQLTSVTIGNSVISIGRDAFYGNQLTNVTIGNSVTSIGDRAFYINQLTEVTIPGSVNSIGDRAFADNPDLATVVTKAIVPPSLHTDAFQYPGRHQIDLIVPSCTKDAYAGWTGFRSITEPEEGETFADGGIIYRITSLVPSTVTAIDYTGTPTDVNIPEMVKGCYTVTAIGNEAFKEKGLTTVVIPNTVTSIGSYAFWNDKLTEVTIPDSVTSIGNDAFAENSLTSVAIPNSVTSIGESAFWNNQLTSVTISNSVTSIKEGTFANNNLTSLTIPDSVASIGNSAFSANDLTEVTIGNSVTSIGDFAFMNNQLTCATIPNSVNSIGDSAFANNPNLAGMVTKATDPPALHADAFQNADRDQIDLIVPEGRIGAYLAVGWMGFRSITEAKVGGTFTDGGITYQITSLEPCTVMAIDYTGAMFTNVNIPEMVKGCFMVTRIGDRVFFRGLLTSVVIPNSVTSIGHWAFATNRFTEVTIPDGVTSIGELAFSFNSDLRTVVTKATAPPSLHANAFQNADRNQIDLIVPVGRKNAYLAAGWTGFKSITESAMAGKSAVVQGTSAAEASPIESAVAPAHLAKANARNNVSVYPNPAQDDIHIGLPDGEALRQVKIYNAMGVHVHSSNTLQMDISHLSSGIYMLEIETKAGERVVKRILVK